jgi:hypothetical protein
VANAYKCGFGSERIERITTKGLVEETAVVWDYWTFGLY